MTKTFYAERPQPLETKVVGKDKYIYYRQNIQEVPTEDGMQYSADEFTGKVLAGKEVTDEVVQAVLDNDYRTTAKEVRAKRNDLLSQTDHMMVDDYPIDHDRLMSYRQALRDLPEQEGWPYAIVWPEK